MKKLLKKFVLLTCFIEMFSFLKNFNTFYSKTCCFFALYHCYCYFLLRIQVEETECFENANCELFSSCYFLGYQSIVSICLCD